MTFSHQTAADYIAEVEAWRRDMDAQMRAPGPGGWLAIVGMYPLETGTNTIGSDPHSTVVLPSSAAPEHLGVLDFDGQHGTLRVTTDETVYVDDVPVRSALLRNVYEEGGMSVVRVRDVSFGVMQWASDPYNIRVWDANAPKRLNFTGRVWYPIDSSYRVAGKFTAYPNIKDMTVDHTGGETQVLKNIGFVEFDLLGKSFHFEACASEKGPGYAWLLMRDGTNGKSTYGGGRFMMAPFINATTLDIDFNKLYQPPCAFCEFTTCPMPPRGNVLPFPLEVGEYFAV